MGDEDTTLILLKVIASDAVVCCYQELLILVDISGFGSECDGLYRIMYILLVFVFFLRSHNRIQELTRDCLS